MSLKDPDWVLWREYKKARREREDIKMEDVITVDVYKLHPNVPTPSYGTTLSSCFDLCFFPTHIIKGFDENNKSFERSVDAQWDDLLIKKGERVLVPTGLIMKIRDTASGVMVGLSSGKLQQFSPFSIRLHMRSGISLKRGLILANSEGIIDADYQMEIFMMLSNISEIPVRIKRGERICQGEIIKNKIAHFNVVEELPKASSERNGGFGSTGS